MMRRLAMVVGVLVALASGNRLAAQGTTGAIRGSVRDTLGRTIAGAEVTIQSLAANLTVRTGADGRYSIRDAPPGVYVLAVRAIGYAPMESSIEIHRDATIEVSPILSALVALDTVHITATPPECEQQTTLAGFNCRRLRMTGVFIDRLAIDRRKPIFLADIFWDVPGFRVVPARHGRAVVPARKGDCVRYLENGRPAFGMSARPADILAVEVYRDFKSTPKAYRIFAWNDHGLPLTCGIVNYWLYGAAR